MASTSRNSNEFDWPSQYEQFAGGDVFSAGLSIQDRFSQSFTTTSSFRLDYVECMIYVSLGWGYSTVDHVFCDIYAADGNGKPTGSVLGTTSLSFAELADGTDNYSRFAFAPVDDDGEVTYLTTGTAYCFVLYTDSASSNEGIYATTLLGAYAGVAHRSLDSGGTWATTQTGDRDNAFRVYGYAPEPAKAWTPTPVNNAVSQPIDTAMTWAAGDAYALSYDVYFDKYEEGVIPPPVTKVIDNENVNIYTPGANLEVDSDYYWRVDTKNAYGTTEGDVWKFTTGAAIPVSTPAEFQAIKDNPSASYYLVNDIDMVGVEYTPIGNPTDGYFTGILNGAGYTVSNIAIDEAASDYRGVFAYISTGGYVSNLKITLVDITADDYVGGFVAYATGCTITNCRVTGEVNGGGLYVGGFAGYVTGATNISKCCSTVTVTNTGFYSGGFVGFKGGTGTISDCYASGDITSTSLIVGGFVGQVGSGTISNCYSTGIPDGSAVEGGFCGMNSGTISGCYYDSTTSGLSDTGKGVPTTTANMKKMATFSGWDFETPDTWDLSEDNTYPLFETMPSQVSNPVPADEATEVGPDELELTWDAADPYPATTYKVWFGTDPDALALLVEGLETESYTFETLLDWDTTYYWAIDTVDQNRTTLGEVWSFESLDFEPPLPSGFGGGTYGTAGEFGGEAGKNCMITVQRLVVAANGKLFYENS